MSDLAIDEHGIPSRRRLDTLDAIRVEKESLERHIEELVTAFENYTHLKVENIKVSHIEAVSFTGHKRKRITVEALVRI